MKDAFEKNGFWWVQGEEDVRLPGRVNYSQDDGVTLEVFSEESFNPRKPTQYEVIYGIIEGNKPVSLFNCFRTHEQTNFFGGITQTEYRVRHMFVGGHFSDYSDVKFNSLSARYDDLDTWKKGSDFSVEVQDEDGKSPQMTVKFPRFIRKPFQVSDEIQVSIRTSSAYSQNPTEFSVEQKTYIDVFSTDERKSFEELFGFIRKCSTLLQLASQRTPYILDLNGLTDVCDEDGKKRTIPIQVYYHPVEVFRRRRKLLFSDYLFSMDDLSEEMVKNWIEKSEQHSHQLSLYHTLFLSERTFLETRFINIVTALESLHSQLFDNKYLETGEFMKRKKAVLAAAPEAYKEWLKNSLGSANYKRFRNKILELIKNKEQLIHRLIPDPESFVKSIHSTRNQLVHLSKKKDTLSPQELTYAIYTLRFVFEAYLLEMIGFSDGKIEEIYTKRTKRYLQWAKVVY